jgi:transposase
MDSVTSAFPDRQLHVILDNLNTHKKNEHWLKVHPNVKFHFTPTSASWRNQVEVWFSILQGQSLSGASFTSLQQLEQHINAYTSTKLSPSSGPRKRSVNVDSRSHLITQL